MRTLSLPIDNSLFPINDRDKIDMSNLNFDIEKDLHIRACFVYLRNINIPNIIEFDFSLCSFKIKSEYLVMYITGDANVNMRILNQTWIKILSFGYTDISIDSILNDDEINQFIVENNELVYELRRFMVSMPLCSMNYYFIQADIPNDLGFNTSSFDKFNIANIINLFNYDEFLTLCTLITDISPVFYEKYFFFSKDFKSVKNPYITPLISCFPYIDLINILYEDDEMKKKFMDELDKKLNENIMEE